MKYDLTVGLEIHAELNTQTKLFCGCKNDPFGSEPNANLCPICLSYPGVKPLTNRHAVELAIMAGHAFDCKIDNILLFERKHYNYPDIPKGYQTSQDLRPICKGGHVVLGNSGKKINLNRIHLEEDAGKLVHDEVKGQSLLDLNRGGVPLIEMVTEPDFTTAKDAVEFLEEVRSRLVFSGVADCRMEQGGMRCDVNISIKPKGTKKLGDRVEIKNLNSFKSVERAIEFEYNRQVDLLEKGKTIATETRRWNDGGGNTIAMRKKETAHDYNYMIDPNIPVVAIASKEVKALKDKMPPLAHHMRTIFTTEFGLSPYEAEILTREKSICDFFVASLKLIDEPKKVANWLLNHVLAMATNFEFQITPVQFVDVIKLTDAKKITKQNSLVLLEEIWGKADSAEALAKKLGIMGGVSEEEIKKIIAELLKQNPKAVADYTSTPDKVINFFMGQVMKQTKGMADSEVVKGMLSTLLSS